MKKNSETILLSLVHAALLFSTALLCSCGGETGEDAEPPLSIESKPGQSSPLNQGDKPDGDLVVIDGPLSGAVGDRPENELDAIQKASLEQAVLIQLGDGSAIPGAIIPQNAVHHGAGPDAEGHGYIISAAPGGQHSIRFSRMEEEGLGRYVARFLAKLPSGLSLYSISNPIRNSATSLYEIDDSKPVSAIRLEIEELYPQQEPVEIDEEVRNELILREEQLHKRLMQRPRSSEEAMQLRHDRRTILAELHEVRSELRKMGQGHPPAQIKSLSAKSVAKAGRLNNLQLPGENTHDVLLVSDSGAVIAIRHEDDWVGLKQAIDGVLEAPVEVSLDVSGMSSRVSVHAQVHWPIASLMAEPVQMVATTIYELESIEGETLEDRLGNTERVEAAKSSGDTRVSRTNIPWNGRPTTLWVRLYRERDNFEVPFVDEQIEISYERHFSGKWAKPPSEIIRIPERRPDEPEDFVGKQSVLELPGQLLDMVPAGDGSVVMLKVDAAPYWLPLEIDTKTLGDPSWPVGEDTLLAAQADNLYLLHADKQLLEVWSLKSMERVDAHVLQFEGKPVSITAPRINPDGLILVATDRKVHCLDPVEFEPVRNNLDLGEYYENGTQSNNRQPTFVPETIRLRADQHGRLYTMSGALAPDQSTSTPLVKILIDPHGMVYAVNSEPLKCISPAMRDLISGFPDHGGSDITVSPIRSYGNKFPVPPSSLVFKSSKNSKLATLNSSPVDLVFPNDQDNTIPFDRALYFDAGRSTVLIPDGNHIHIMEISLLDSSQMLPESYFVDEPIVLPLPSGSDHNLTSSIDGVAKLGEGSFQWKSAPGNQYNNVSLDLAWKGDLGTELKETYRFRLMGQWQEIFYAVSPNEYNRLPLKPAGFLPSKHNIVGLAGSGNVVLLSYVFGEHEAWNLHTLERLVHIQEERGRFFGDAGQVYLLAQDGRALTSYDLLTGKKMKQAIFGNPSESFTGLSAIGVGYASNRPLLAVEREKHKGFLEHIDRHTLNPSLLHFPEDISRLLFSCSEFKTSPSGKISWYRQIGIETKGRDVSVSQYKHSMSGGQPDASGRFIVTSNEILDIGQEPPKLIRLGDIVTNSDNESYTSFTTDLSGKYLIVQTKEREKESSSPTWTNTWSFREIRNPAKELVKLSSTSNSGGATVHYISDVGKLLIPRSFGGGGYVVYDFDVEDIMKQLSELQQEGAGL